MKNIIRCLLIFAVATVISPSQAQTSFTNEREGLIMLAAEIDALIKFSGDVEQSPKTPGRTDVNYEAMQRELIVMRNTLNWAAGQPDSARKIIEKQSTNDQGSYLK